jgi:hypothetical protein
MPPVLWQHIQNQQNAQAWVDQRDCHVKRVVAKNQHTAVARVLAR